MVKQPIVVSSGATNVVFGKHSNNQKSLVTQGSPRSIVTVSPKQKQKQQLQQERIEETVVLPPQIPATKKKKVVTVGVSSPTRPKKKDDQRRFSKWLSIRTPAAAVAAVCGSHIHLPSVPKNIIGQENNLSEKLSSSQSSWFQELKIAYILNSADNRTFFFESESYFFVNIACFITQLIFTCLNFGSNMITAAYIRIALQSTMILVNFSCAFFNSMYLEPNTDGPADPISQLPSYSQQSHPYKYSSSSSASNLPTSSMKKQPSQQQQRRSIPQWISYLVIIANIVVAAELEFNKRSTTSDYSYSNNTNNQRSSQSSDTENQSESNFLEIENDSPIISMYSIAVLYSLFMQAKQIKGVDGIYIILTQIVGLIYFYTRYLMKDESRLVREWEIMFGTIIVLGLVFRKGFWQTIFMRNVKEQLIENQMKEGIVKNIKSFYNNVFELMPQGIAIIDSQKDLIFNNAAIKTLMDCDTLDLVKSISNIVLKQKTGIVNTSTGHALAQTTEDNNNHNNQQSNTNQNNETLPAVPPLNQHSSSHHAQQIWKKSPTAPEHLFRLVQNGSLGNMDAMESSHPNFHGSNSKKQHRGSRGSLKQMRINKSSGILQSGGSMVCENIEQIIDELLLFGEKNKRKKNLLKRVHTVVTETTARSKAFDEDQNVMFSNDSVSVQFKKNRKHLLLKIFVCEYSIKLDNKSGYNSQKSSKSNDYDSNFDEMDFIEPVLLVIIEDITDQILKKELEMVTQYRLKLLASVSHELKTPLNCSINFLEHLAGEVPPEIFNEFVVPALASNRYLYNVFNDILDYSSIETKHFNYRFSKFSLYDLLQDSLDILNFRTKLKEIEVKYDFDDDIPAQIISDEARIRQIALNLLSNAIKYSRVAGKITLSATHLTDGLIQISVEDTGIGITAETQSMIFNFGDRRDFLTKNSRLNMNTQGIGLGLQIASRLARGLSTHTPPIQVKSTLNEGSIFTFYIQNQPQSILNLDHHMSSPSVLPRNFSFSSINSPMLHHNNNPSNNLLHLHNVSGAAAPGSGIVAALAHNTNNNNNSALNNSNSGFENNNISQSMVSPVMKFTPSKFQMKYSTVTTSALKKFDISSFHSNSMLDSCELTRFSHVLSDDHIQLPQEPFHLRFRDAGSLVGGVSPVSLRNSNVRNNMNNSSSFVRPVFQQTSTTSFFPTGAAAQTSNNGESAQFQQQQQGLKDTSILESAKLRCSCAQILYIDDNEFNLVILQNMIKRLGYSCDIALSCDIGLKKIENRFSFCSICLTYSLIFCDIDMPIKDGYQTSREILQYYAAIEMPDNRIPPIIACSALNIPDFQELCKQAGMAYFLPKPIDKNTLKQILCNIQINS